MEAMTDKVKDDQVASKNSDGEKGEEDLEAVRMTFLARFGQVAISMMGVPRYAHMSIGDLQHLVLEPMIRNRIAIATAKPNKEEGILPGTIAGVGIWASVSEDVDEKIREQITSGVFPVRLKGDEWTSGDKAWLLDVIAPTQKLATAVLANFRQVVANGELSLHPIVSKMIDPEILKKMGARSEVSVTKPNVDTTKEELQTVN